MLLLCNKKVAPILIGEFVGNSDLGSILMICGMLKCCVCAEKNFDGHFNSADPIPRYRDVTYGGRHKEMLIGRHQFSFFSLVLLARDIKQIRIFFMFQHILTSNRNLPTPPQKLKIMQIEFVVNRMLIGVNYNLSSSALNVCAGDLHKNISEIKATCRRSDVEIMQRSMRSTLIALMN